MTRDPLALFDDAVIAEIATEFDISAEVLRGAARRHQEQMRDLPGVDDLVYEWRKTLPREPLVDRRDDAYLLVIHPGVWPQFVDALDLREAELDALRELHARVLAAEVDAAEIPDDERDAMIVVRE